MVAVRKRKQVTYNESDSDFMSEEEVAVRSRKPPAKKANNKKTAKRQVKKKVTPEPESESEFEEEQEEVPEEEPESEEAKEEAQEESDSKNVESDEEIYDADSTIKSKLVIPRPKGSPFPDAISPDTLEFLAELIENNDRDFMHLKAKEWVAVKKDFTDFCGLVMKEMVEVDPAVRVEDAKRAVYRQNRDLRFTNDKRPYKTNMSASFSRTGRKFLDAGYHISVRPDNKTIVAAGIWQPNKEMLENMRSSIIRNGDLLREALSTDALKDIFNGKYGVDIMETSDKLKVAPKGIAKDHPEIDLLRFRSFAVAKSFTDEEVVSPGFLDKVMDVFEALVPLVAVINSWV